MSEASSQLRAEQQETQSMQSVNVQSAPVNLTQTQRSSSQAERSDRSGGRQRFQRSSSSGSSSSESGRDNRGATNASGAGSQLYANGVGFAQNGGIESGSQGSFASGERRRGRFRRQVIRLPDQAQGQVRQVRRRLPTPEPDTIERVYIQRTAGEVVEEITEIPTTPPPRIQERTQIEPAGPPQVIKRVIRVPPRGTGAYDANYQQGQAATNFQTSSVSVGSESLAQTQQVNTGFNYPQPQPHHQQQQQQQFAAPTGIFTQPGAAHQGQQSAFQFSVNSTGFPSQPVRPPVGCHPAFCFYV